MLVDNQYTADYGNGQYSYTQQSAPNGYGAHEQAGYPPAPTNGNKEEEGMYRYASSRLTGQASHTTSKPSSVHNGHGQNPMAELNSLSHQQPPQGSSPHLRTPVTYQSHPVRNSSTSQPDYSTTDVFMPSNDATNPNGYYNQYEPDKQTFQNSAHPHRTAYDHTRKNTNPFINHPGSSSEPNPSNNDQLFFTDSESSQQRGPAHPPQRNLKTRFQPINGKGLDQNSTKRDLPARGKGAALNSYAAQYASMTSQSPRQPAAHGSVVSTQPNYIEKNIDMIKHKEGYFHRYPPQNYTSIFTKRRLAQGEGDYDASQDLSPQSTLPLTISLSTGDESQENSVPATVDIPLDNYMSHPGENVAVDINLRLLDGQNGQPQHAPHFVQQTERQGSERAHWSTMEALDRHIRKMERSINHTLPVTNSYQRPQLTMSNAGSTLSTRTAITTTGPGHTTFTSLPHARDTFTYSEKGPEDTSYLTQMHHERKSNEYKPFTVRDYAEFKKNHRFGTGYLGFDADNTTYKEKVEKANKAREYAQQVGVRNRKAISEVASHAASETPSSPDDAKTPRTGRLTKRTVRYSSKSTHSSPVSLTKIVPIRHALASPHRVNEVFHQPTSARRPVQLNPHSPPPRRLVEVVSPASSTRRQAIRFTQHDEHEVVDRHDDRDVPIVTRRTNPSRKRREPNDENDSSYLSSPASNRTVTRRISPVKVTPPASRLSGDSISKRRPLRLDNHLPIDDEPQHASPVHIVERVPVEAPAEDVVMKVIRDELTERPLEVGEELVIIQ